MDLIERNIVYFADSGPQNSEKVKEAVKKRIVDGDIGAIIVASTSGNTGVKFSKEFNGTVSIIAVSHKEMNPAYKRQISEYGGKAFDKTHLALHAVGMDDVRNSFRVFGQGFKVAVEVILIAADLGAVELHKDVVGVGGTGNGVDTAIIARATTSREIFTKDRAKKLEVREIIAMPLRKHWW